MRSKSKVDEYFKDSLRHYNVLSNKPIVKILEDRIIGHFAQQLVNPIQYQLLIKIKLN